MNVVTPSEEVMNGLREARGEAIEAWRPKASEETIKVIDDMLSFKAGAINQ